MSTVSTVRVAMRVVILMILMVAMIAGVRICTWTIMMGLLPKNGMSASNYNVCRVSIRRCQTTGRKISLRPMIRVETFNRNKPKYELGTYGVGLGVSEPE